jgi:hypothetical protein
MSWVKIDDQFTDPSKMPDLMPLSDFPEAKREEILFLATQDSPPPKWLNFGLCQIVSRAWLEWHMRHGENHPTRIAWDLMRSEIGPLIYARDGYKCTYCGSKKDLSVDHIVPVSRGGSNENDNLVTACRSCNSSKGDKMLNEWRS